MNLPNRFSELRQALFTSVDPKPKFVFMPVVSPPPFSLFIKKATQSIMHSVVGSMTSSTSSMLQPFDHAP